MKRCCDCRSCRARNARDFERLIDANYSRAARVIIESRVVAETIRDAQQHNARAYRGMVDRVNQYVRAPLPAIPEWEGEPRELDI